MLEYYTLNEALEQFKYLKEKGFVLPTKESLEQKQFAQISAILQNSQTVKSRQFDAIETRHDFREVAGQALYLFSPFKSKRLNHTIKNILSDNLVKVSQKISPNISCVRYDEKDNHAQDIVIAPVQSDVQSISLASAIASILKNTNPEEYQNHYIDEKVIPYFLEEMFSQKLSRESAGNASLQEATALARIMHTINASKVYEELNEAYEQGFPADQYRAWILYVSNIYRDLYGMVEALKLYKKYQENQFVVLKAVKEVLSGQKTTSMILQELELNTYQEVDLVKEKCQSLRLIP